MASIILHYASDIGTISSTNSRFPPHVGNATIYATHIALKIRSFFSKIIHNSKMIMSSNKHTFTILLSVSLAQYCAVTLIFYGEIFRIHKNQLMWMQLAPTEQFTHCLAMLKSEFESLSESEECNW